MGVPHGAPRRSRHDVPIRVTQVGPKRAGSHALPLLMAQVEPDLMPHDDPNRITDWPHFVPTRTTAVFCAPPEVSNFLTSGGTHGFFSLSDDFMCIPLPGALRIYTLYPERPMHEFMRSNSRGYAMPLHGAGQPPAPCSPR